MKNQYLGHIVIFLVATLFAYIFSISPSLTKAKAVVTLQQEAGDELLVRMKVCPPFWFDDNSSKNSELKALYRNTLTKFIENRPSTNLIPETWLVKSITLDSENLIKEDYKTDGRCHDLSTKLLNHEDEKPAKIGSNHVSRLFQDDTILRVGVRDKQGFISQYDPKTQKWRGAAIDFARLIAKEMGKTAVFTRLKSLESRFTSLRYGVADLSISLISYTKERSEIAYLSEPYYTTGLVLGTFISDSEVDLHRTRSDINSGKNTIVAVHGSNSVVYIQNNFPKSNIVTTTTSAEIPVYVHELMADPSRENIYYITDELIASRWPESRIVYVDKKRLLTSKDAYVVAMGDLNLLPVVNRVIASGVVSNIYTTSYNTKFSTGSSVSE
ncbi:MAG: transporter substrate-binding domain-containing protein [Magnetococcales bacterium]|nr:transporter substrate-binding domain-containing protein [Magnetococcales bacterium]